jgi:anthranilate phosphoribosyltransferase
MTHTYNGPNSNHSLQTLEEIRFLSQGILKKLSQNKHLNHDEINNVMVNITNGKCSDIFVSAFLMALAVNGVNYHEYSGVIKALRSVSIRISPLSRLPLVDNCGTGGDMLNTFNISTVAAIIASSSNRVAVAKHGNRSSSGLSGSADLFEHIGYPLENKESDEIINSIETFGLGFLFAPNYHPGLRYLSHIRKELGVQTIFNKIGPLCNPCSNLYAQVIGVSDPVLVNMIPKIIPILGLKRAMIVRSEEGMDELSTTGKNTVVHVIQNEGKYVIQNEILDPLELGIPRASINDIIVQSKRDAINESLRIIYGLYHNKPKENIVLLNSAAILVAGNIVNTFKEGFDIAQASLREGRPQKLLQELVKSIGEIAKLEMAEKAIDV